MAKSLNSVPYNRGSKSAAALSRSLTQTLTKRMGKETKSLRIKANPAETKFRGSPAKTVINWGGSDVPKHIAACSLLNQPAKVGAVSNKLKFFKLMDGKLRIPEWTTNKAEVTDWVGEQKNKDRPAAFARSKLNGHSG